MSSTTDFVGDRAVLSLLVEVSTPSLAFSTRVVEAHEPVRIQAFGAKLCLKDSMVSKSFLRMNKDYSTSAKCRDFGDDGRDQKRRNAFL